MFQRILLITQREYLVRVRKKSFIVMTILTPLLIATLYGIIIYVNLNKDLGDTEKQILVSDNTGLFVNKLAEDTYTRFSYALVETGQEAQMMNSKGYFGILYITSDTAIRFISKEATGITFINALENKIENVLKSEKMKALQLDAGLIESVNNITVDVATSQLTAEGTKETESYIPSALAFAGSLLIYFFIFMYGVQVMRGVIEEKSNRIVEILISSVKPFELMMGKITGIVSVGLTQLIIWIFLIAILAGGASGLVTNMMQSGTLDNIQQLPATGKSQIMDSIAQIEIVPLLAGFIFYFITGYLLYAAMFAAVGSAVDSETETQQFVLPVTLPLILAMVFAQNIILSNPSGNAAFWLSIFPLTSPIVMMCRIPFGVPAWQLALSASVMLASIFGVIWLASKIYRVGILMYGKKAGYREIAKWILYK